MFLKKSLQSILLLSVILLTTPIPVHATQLFSEYNGNSWVRLNNSSNGSAYLLHNSSNGSNLEFTAIDTNGVTTWQALNINKNGRVSIGTQNPFARFEVNNSNIPNVWAGRFLQSNIDVRLGYSGGYGIFVRSDNAGGTYLLQLNNGTTKMFQVDNYGNTHVNGILTAKEIRVKTNIWADYVFEEGYKLKSLNDLEQYINENKHLPNVPSAEKVKENGIPVVEMQRIQMEKIEELTLYTIQQQKEIDLLKAELNNLKARL